MSHPSINERVMMIKSNKDEVNRLIEEYRPFIASVVEKYLGRRVEYGIDDELSVAMIAFDEAVQRYDIKKGNFLAFARNVIRSRLVDYYRRERKNRETVMYIVQNQEDEEYELDISIEESIKKHREEEISEQRRLEILEIKKELEKWGLTFSDVAKSSPKQEGTRRIYLQVIDFIMSSPEILDTIKQKKYLPVDKIVKATKIPRKKIERGRNYIIAAVIILSGDYRYIKEYIKWG
ncbi:RNA polymerase sigma factor SigI [Thermosediminibacter oceani]|uniref:RNA polymerase sigma factor SigI n=1 Tax=Thermosediminibacter oceani (strain ATCC BAA-1034 / DSM 16646 / JW/IW-1228P) TaxID=555079 RepID=D9RZZ1_THEOJ|nr:RNA polymerase sigma factor SigI [Thermosediminibacter oceani]ADL08768.1 RNA polymerase, sigma 28 subunit, FliA/WhiG subfamily [Thermosediminibacter oceani DSM 16646]